MPVTNDTRLLHYERTLDGRTETMIPIGPHVAISETSARTLGLLSKDDAASKIKRTAS